MDNIPTGEIYSAYQGNAPGTAEGNQTDQSGPQETQPQIQPEYPTEGGFPPVEPPDTASAAPPFGEESKVKKIIILALIILVIAAVLFLAVSFFLRKKTPSAPKEITLTYWGLFEDQSIFQPIIDEYKRSHPNIIINYMKQDQKQYRERLQAALTRGEGPDIFRIHNTWIPMFLANLEPMPKTIYSDVEFAKTFFPVASRDLKVGENYYGVPLMIDGLLLFYNEDILKSANTSVPATWDDVLTTAAKLTVKEKGRIITSGIAMGTAENIEHFSDILGLMMMQNGVELTNSLFKCVNPQVTDCAVQVLSFYRTFADPPNNTWDETLENSILAFAGGKVAMIFAPSWQIFTLKNLNPNLNFKTAKVPQLPCEKEPCPSINWATYWVEGVSNKSKNPAQAWEFLKYLSEEATQKKLYEAEIKQRQLFGEPYSRADLAGTLIGNQYLAPLMEEAPTMASFYLAARTMDGENTGLDSILIKYMQDAVNSLSQGGSPETALQTADSGFKQTLTRFGIKSSAK